MSVLPLSALLWVEVLVLAGEGLPGGRDIRRRIGDGSRSNIG